MKKETLKKANAIHAKIDQENNSIMAYRQWVEEITNHVERSNGNKKQPPSWTGTISNDHHVQVFAPVKEFCFLLDLARMSHEQKLAALEAELATLGDELEDDNVSPVEYEER